MKDLPKKSCRWIEKVADTRSIKIFCDATKRKQDAKKARSPFSTGCRVKHPVWGIGVVRDCYGDGEDQKVMVNFPQIGLKRLSLRLANLTKL